MTYPQNHLPQSSGNKKKSAARRHKSSAGCFYIHIFFYYCTIPSFRQCKDSKNVVSKGSIQICLCLNVTWFIVGTAIIVVYRFADRRGIDADDRISKVAS